MEITKSDAAINSLLLTASLISQETAEPFGFQPILEKATSGLLSARIICQPSDGACLSRYSIRNVADRPAPKRVIVFFDLESDMRAG